MAWGRSCYFHSLHDGHRKATLLGASYHVCRSYAAAEGKHQLRVTIIKHALVANWPSRVAVLYPFWRICLDLNTAIAYSLPGDSICSAGSTDKQQGDLITAM